MGLCGSVRGSVRGSVCAYVRGFCAGQCVGISLKQDRLNIPVLVDIRFIPELQVDTQRADPDNPAFTHGSGRVRKFVEALVPSQAVIVNL